MNTQTDRRSFKYGDVVTVATYPGIAFWVGGPTIDTIYDENIDDTYDEIREGFYDCMMVGDDRIHIVDVDDMRFLEGEEYCSVCGQIGCGHGAS